MSHFKTFNRVLISILTIVSVYLSLDCIIIEKSSSTDYNIALIKSERQYDNDIINFSYYQHYFLLEKPIEIDNKISSFEFEIQNKNLLDKLKFHNQKNIVLNLKPILLPIVLNKITIQKSYCI